MLTQEKIMALARRLEKITTQEVAKRFRVSRQYASRNITDLVQVGKLLRIGSTRSAFYVTPQYAQKRGNFSSSYVKKVLNNKNLEEHKILEDMEKKIPALVRLPENVKSIFEYAFSEMLNNAIEHSGSKKIIVEIHLDEKLKKLVFLVQDSGIGVFRSVMKKRKLASEMNAVQDILKGKTTTMPKSHSGEGIFFTSKMGEYFVLESFDYKLSVHNLFPDVFITKTNKNIKGTRVTFITDVRYQKHLNDVFKKYTDAGKNGDYGFSKTEIRIKLYTLSGIHVSRSQARRVLVGLEKFKFIIFDFDKVPMVGQAFVDEIFRVFHNKYPHIKMKVIHAKEPVQFMIHRAKANL